MKVWYLEYEDLAAVFDSCEKALTFFEKYISKEKNHKFRISRSQEDYLELTVTWPDTYLTYDNVFTYDFIWDPTVKKSKSLSVCFRSK